MSQMFLVHDCYRNSVRARRATASVRMTVTRGTDRSGVAGGQVPARCRSCRFALLPSHSCGASLSRYRVRRSRRPV